MGLLAIVMGLVEAISTYFLRSTRKSYNSGNYRSSLIKSRIIFTLFQDRESLDIIARSNLRLEKFSAASRAYRRANDLGLALLDHEANHFKSALFSENYPGAFVAMRKIPSKRLRKIKTIELTKHLKRLTDTERVRIIQKMNAIGPLPSEIAKLLPWSPRKIEVSSIDQSFTPLDRDAVISDR